MKKINTIILFLLLGFVSQAQDFDLKGYLELNQITEGTFNTVPEVSVGHPDADSIKRYVKKAIGNTEMYVGGYPIKVDFDLVTGMKWVKDAQNNHIGLLKVKCSGARMLGVGFDAENIPLGTKVYFTNLKLTESMKIEEYVLAFMKKRQMREAGLGVIYGDESYILIIATPAQKDSLKIVLKRIDYGFPRSEDNLRDAENVESATCHKNIICPEGNDWVDEKKGVVRINISATQTCTGTLINNTSLDGTPYVLTACHCVNNPAQNLYYDAAGNNSLPYTFDFNYESSTCDPSSSSSYSRISNGVLVANESTSDFALIELSQKPYDVGITNAYYNGWNNTSLGSGNYVGISHPWGDVKKIAVTGTVGSSSTPNHYALTWSVGTSEPGSSGCPIFNSSHQIIGQMHGPASPCDATTDVCDCRNRAFGGLYHSWDSYSSSYRNLKYWLDPYDTYESSLPGGTYGACQNTRNVTENISVKRNVTANNIINATNYILAGADVEYRASQAINLGPGFTVSPFAYFHAIIDPNPCVPNVPIFKTDERSEQASEISTARNDVGIKTYPNPFTDQVQVEISGVVVDEPFTISIFDLQGHLLLTSNKVAATVNESYTILFPKHFAKGVYILSCNGETINQVVKLIKS